MTSRSPDKLYTGFSRLESLAELNKRSVKRSRIGVTRGGSSRKNAGAKVAATRAKFKPTQWK
jgi:hypothetical protein